jgi:hypothetical protein
VRDGDVQVARERRKGKETVSVETAPALRLERGAWKGGRVFMQ